MKMELEPQSSGRQFPEDTPHLESHHCLSSPINLPFRIGLSIDLSKKHFKSFAQMMARESPSILASYLLSLVATMEMLCWAMLSLSRSSFVEMVPSTGSMSK